MYCILNNFLAMVDCGNCWETAMGLRMKEHATRTIIEQTNKQDLSLLYTLMAYQVINSFGFMFSIYIVQI